MKRQIDLLLGGILLAAPVVLNVPAQSTSLQLAGGRPSAFSESYFLTSAKFPPALDPETYQQLGGLGMLVVGPYVVQQADTLEGIAKRFASGADFLRSTNRLNSVYIPIGKQITVHNGKG